MNIVTYRPPLIIQYAFTEAVFCKDLQPPNINEVFVGTKNVSGKMQKKIPKDEKIRAEFSKC